MSPTAQQTTREKKINKQMNMKIWIHFVEFKTIEKEHWIGSAAKKK